MSAMGTNNPPYRTNASDRRTYGGISYDTYTSIHTNFLHEEIQPTVMRNNDFHSVHNDDRPPFGRKTNFSTGRSNNFRLPNLVSGFIQQQPLQPHRVITGNDEPFKRSISETKKRSRSRYHDRTKSTTRESNVELRIEGKSLKIIIDKISSAQESSSVLLKGIRELPIRFVDSRSGDTSEESILLLDSLKDLVKNKGSMWKSIRIHECSSSVVDILLASEVSTDFEEIHIVGMCDDKRYQYDDYSLQIDPSLQSESESILTTIDTQTRTSFVIMALLKKMSRIKKVVLNGCNLDNIDLNRIMGILCAHPNHPKSLEHLDLRFNKFTPNALQSVLAIHLKASLHSLKTVKLRQGLRCIVSNNIRHAILQSLKCNQVILEYIDIFDWDKSVQCLLDINRAKRRYILCNSDRFPRSLWPLLLEQVVVVDEENDVVNSNKSQSKSPLFVHRERNSVSTRRQASVFYHIFRNGGPMLLERHHDQSINYISFDSN